MYYGKRRIKKHLLYFLHFSLIVQDIAVKKREYHMKDILLLKQKTEK